MFIAIDDKFEVVVYKLDYILDFYVKSFLFT
jgi:hypothetical protein